ncbi:SWIM zinc finger family protein [Pyrobaculum sp. 3827-6]|uniref:SWIM zinc finger family protein n=1 Tax=Pyrobaculum sp. 3827-6 TaxID=2983604 RepID=UPI0021DB09CF|nr:SWIM zinc finger family protein [Pyrobaculum sp. 3827-6]MCU7788867.1 SWIM zinc finger family protein [Pyrobaculum sp. 3827-6]
MQRDPLRSAVEALRADFPGKSRSWIRRALLRLGDVKEVREDLYVVEGRRELGDWKPLYQVWWSEAEKRWLCTCYYSQFGLKRRRDICTHVAAVMLFRRYKKALEKAERGVVYVAEAVVECRGRISANGELHVKPTADKIDLTFFASPRFRVLVVSRSRRITVKCGGYVVYEAEGEEVPLAVAKFLAEKFHEGKD